MNVGCVASMWVARVLTPFTWLYVPVRIEARLGAHSEFVTKQFSSLAPRAPISSMRGVRLTTEP
jgi:hypothetical protein